MKRVQLAREKCVAGNAEPVFDNPANLKKIDALFRPPAAAPARSL